MDPTAGDCTVTFSEYGNTELIALRELVSHSLSKKRQLKKGLQKGTVHPAPSRAGGAGAPRPPAYRNLSASGEPSRRSPVQSALGGGPFSPLQLPHRNTPLTHTPTLSPSPPRSPLHPGLIHLLPAPAATSRSASGYGGISRGQPSRRRRRCPDPAPRTALGSDAG